MELDIEPHDDPPGSGWQEGQHGEPAGQFAEIRERNRVDRPQVIANGPPVPERDGRSAVLKRLHDRPDRARVRSPQADE